MRWIGGRAFLSDARIRRAARAALRAGGRPDLELSLVFVRDRELTRMHADWLGDPSPTDVLSFDLGDAGEVVTSFECARRTARARGVEPGRELSLYVVHGVLHLCGLDDRTKPERVRMRAAERAVLLSLGWEDDPEPHDELRRRRGAAP